MKENVYNRLDMDNLLIQCLIGPVSASEKKQLEEWLKESKDNQRYFNQLKEIYFLGKTTKNPSGFNKEVSLERVKSRYYKLKYSEQADKRKTLSIRRMTSLAAAFIIALGVGFFLRSLFPAEKATTIHAIVYNEVFAPRGSRSLVTLPDGSTVWLNAGSSLKYPMNFLLGDREVTLSGEAYFDVAKMEKKRFIVKASDLAIKVWGTKFNVKAYPEEKTIETTLVEGSVSIQKIKSTSREKETYLMPNQTAIFYKTDSKESMVIRDNNTLNKKEPEPSMEIKQKVNTVLYTSWKDDAWIIEGEELGNLATQLERRYDVKIVFTNNSLKDYRFTGTFKNETFEQLLEIIKISAPVDYSIINNVVLLKENTTSKKKYDEFLTR